MISKIKMSIVVLFLAAVACGVSLQPQPHSSSDPQGQKPRQPESADQKSPSTDGNVSNSASGTITSGGGYIYGYESNPWFLGNVNTVRYCIDLDEANFGVRREMAAAAIERSIASWKKTFARAHFARRLEEPVGTLVIGTQNFELVTCSDDAIDLRFQLGRLTDEQKKFVPNPNRFVAVTVEQHYDEENMRGRGFIYVSPESGDLRPVADDLADHYWQF
jgi:hypothetical protein